jgi:hypothetical protein
MWQGRRNPSPGTTDVKLAGMPIGLGTSSAGSGNRELADRAINSAAAEINHCEFRDTMARRDPSFDHDPKMRPGSENLIMRSMTGRIVDFDRDRIGRRALIY